MKISAHGQAARRVTLEELYDEYCNVGDNWMLVGSSFIGDRNHHRLIGDLAVAECGPFLRELLDLAERDCLRKFPEADSQRRTRDWFALERARLDKLLDDCNGGSLVDLYKAWLGDYLGNSIGLDVTSSMFSLEGGAPGRFDLLELFLRDYDTAASLYNQAIDKSETGLHPLRTKQGELPFFAVSRHLGRLVRTEVFLQGNQLLLADQAFSLGPDKKLPIDALKQAGVLCITGKAVILALQVRTGKTGGSLALPYNGSLYMPAVREFQKLLSQNGLLPAGCAQPKPVLRVRFHLLDKMRELQTVVSLPEHLSRAFGQKEIRACDFAEGYGALATQARARLEQFRDKNARQTWLAETFPRETNTIQDLENRKRKLAKENQKLPEIREIWKKIREIQNRLQKDLLQKVTDYTQVSQVDFWDSRGAILPWCQALAGEDFYHEVLADVQFTEEIY